MSQNEMQAYLSCLNLLTEMLATRSADLSPQMIMERLSEPLLLALNADDCALGVAGPQGELQVYPRSQGIVDGRSSVLTGEWLLAQSRILSVLDEGAPHWLEYPGRPLTDLPSALPETPVTDNILLLPFGPRSARGVLALSMQPIQEEQRDQVIAFAMPLAQQLGLLLASSVRARARRRARDVYRNIFEGITDGALLLDSDGLVISANDAAVDLLRWPRARVLGLSFQELMVDKEGHIASASAAALARGESVSTDLMLRRGDGSSVSVVASGHRVHLEDEPVYLVLVTDTQTRLGLEAQLRHRLAQLESLYAMTLATTADATGENMLERIVERACTLVRAGFGGIFLYDREEDALVLKVAQKLPEQYLGMRISLGEGVAGRVFQSGQPANVFPGSPDHERVSGMPGLGIAAALVMPMRWGDHAIGVLAVCDMNPERRFTPQDQHVVGLLTSHAALVVNQATIYRELQRSTEELARANLELRELDRMKDDLLAVVTHELRRPLASARLNIELVQDSATALSAQDERLLQSAIANIDAQTRMVDDLLDAARKGRLPPLAVRLHDLRRLVDDQVLAVQQAALQARLHLTWDLPAEPVLGQVEPESLGRALANLLSNAIKFTPEEGSVHVTLGRDGELARIAVRDTGIGIPAHLHERIFERLFQVDRSARRYHGGIGLGLAIAKEIVARHGGDIRVESQEGQGSLFVIELPLAAQLASV